MEATTMPTSSMVKTGSNSTMHESLRSRDIRPDSMGRILAHPAAPMPTCSSTAM